MEERNGSTVFAAARMVTLETVRITYRVFKVTPHPFFYKFALEEIATKILQCQQNHFKQKKQTVVGVLLWGSIAL